MSTPQSGLTSDEFESYIDSYEVALRREGPPPELGDYLPADGPLRISVLAELVRVDIEFRHTHGHAVRWHDYSERFPELNDSPSLSASLQHAITRLGGEASSLTSSGEGGSPTSSGMAQSASPADIPAGTVLGNYVIRRKLGQGGMGAVYQAVHRIMERPVALKVLPPHIAGDSEAVKRFQREIRLLSRLSHPNLIVAHDADQFQGMFFLAMELVDGSDLFSYVRKSGPLSPEFAVECIMQAARGLDYAHAQGITHRDVKPANLLLGPGGIVKLLDLGLAKMAEDRGEASAATNLQLTGAGVVMGTADYIAPEQIFSAGAVDRRADVYSLGCTLFYLLTGKPVFGGSSVWEKLAAHREQSAPELTEWCALVTAELNAVFQKMVAKRPEDRYPSMREVIRDLEGCLSAARVEGKTNAVSVPVLSNLPNTLAESVHSDAPQRTAADLTWLAGCVLVLLLGGGFVAWLHSNEWKPGNSSGDQPAAVRTPDNGSAASSQDVAQTNERPTLPETDSTLVVRATDLPENPGKKEAMPAEVPANVDVASTPEQPADKPAQDSDKPPQDNDTPAEPLTPSKSPITAPPLAPWKKDVKAPTEVAGITPPVPNTVPKTTPPAKEPGTKKPATRNSTVRLDEDPDRQAATEILRKGGSVRIVLLTDGKESLVKSSTALPTGRFLLTWVSLTALQPNAPVFTDADLALLQNLTALTNLECRAPLVTNRGLAALRNLNSLRVLTIDSNQRITDAGISELQGLTNLESLELINLRITEESLTTIRGFQQLTSLHLPMCGVNQQFNGPVLKSLKDLGFLRELVLNVLPTSQSYSDIRHFGNLTYLSCMGKTLNNAALAHIVELSSLNRLGLISSDVTDAGLVELRKLPQLEHLALWQSNRLTNQGMQSLQPLSLKVLELNFTQIGDAGLKHLQEISSLTTLKLSKTKVTQAGVSAFQQARPGCQVVWP